LGHERLAELDRLKGQLEYLKPGDGFTFASKAMMMDHAFQLQVQGKNRADEQAERQYERGRRALDKRQWDEAVAQFDEAAAASKTIADGALYWKAYALMKLGRGREATAVLDEMAKNYPQSRWLNDAKAMRVEIAQAAGRPVSPEDASDDEIKLMAINALMQNDPERAIPLLEKLMTSPSSPKLRERALFVLSQSDSQKAREALARIAKGGGNPDLQMQAVRALGVHGGKENRQLLADVYGSTGDIGVKKQIINSYMVSGERDRLLAIAKSDPAPELRMAAIRYLGTMGANSQLADMYGSESSVEIRSQILQAMFTAGNSQKLIEIAKTEKEPALRERAIRHLGTMSSATTGQALVEIYGASQDTETRKRILHALFTQGNVKQIVEVARKETNPDLRRAAVQHLSNVRSKEATDFLLEILNK
jgi:HEAT repeat protein